MHRARQLKAASLPFVTRALRGGRRLRYAGVAGLFALLSIVLGAWLALGAGRLEHDLRVGFKLERPMELQEQQDFKIFAEDEEERRSISAAVAAMTRPEALRKVADGSFEVSDYAEIRANDRLREGIDVLTLARTENTPHGRVLFLLLREQRAEAQRLADRVGLGDRAYDRDWVRWSDEELHEQLRSVLASELRPAVVLYSSPLSTTDAVGVIGLVAGSLAMILLMLFAPVLAGTQMAQEVHENTLQPLTGTALSARDLVLGMSLGPAAVIALLAAPQLLIFLAAAIAVGHVLPALGLVAVALASGAFLTMLAQLAGLALGRQRSPGMLGVALLGVLAPLTLLGALLTLELPGRAVGVLALLPQAAASHMLLESFLPAGVALRSPHVELEQLASAQFAVAIGALGMLCFAWLGLRALERRVGESSPTALARGEALLGAFVTTVLITLADPAGNSAESALVNFGLALIPLAILLMMRVPMPETPTAMRKIPIAGLLAEFSAGVAVFFAVSVGCTDARLLDLVASPVALLYLAWTIAVAGLLTIRVAALPMSLLAKIWAGVCTIGVGVALVHVLDWTRSPEQDLEHALGFMQVSPLLGVLQAALLIVIPVLLVRALRHPASTAPAEG